MQQELEKRGVVVRSGATPELRVELIDYRIEPTWIFRGTSRTVVSGGDSFEKQIDVVNNSPANAYRALSGTLARTVITILNDPEVRAYLATGE